MKTIRVSDDEQRVLELALEVYVRLGLGQFGELSRRIDLLHGHRLSDDQRAQLRWLAEEMETVAAGDDPWRLKDDDTSLYTMLAFRLESRTTENLPGVMWANRRIKQKRDMGERVEHKEQPE